MTGAEVRDLSKKFMSWLAGATAAVLVSDAQGMIVLPPMVKSWLGIAGIVLGINGASPLGRIMWKCRDPEEDPTPAPVPYPAPKNTP